MLPRVEIVHEQGDAPNSVGSNQLKNASSATTVQALQAAVRVAFGSRRSGALVALNPNNGQMLALVSIANKQDEKSSKKVRNLALYGNYNPGATIKPFMALAALELGFRTPEDEFSDSKGFAQYGEYQYVDGYRSGHGQVNLHRSIVHSCDTYYYAIAEEMGIDAIHGFLTHFGFGKKPDITCESVSGGILATPAWKDARFKQQWFTSDTIATGIGQGYFLATPLQMASAVAMLANGGTLYQPSLARTETDKDAQVSADSVSDVAAKFPLTVVNLATIRNAMIAATRQGAASRSFADATYLVAGKTGSMPRSAMRKDGSFEAFKDHSLFIGYAPANQPTIALAVVVEDGGFGYQSAAPIARAVFDYVLRNEAILTTVPELPVLEDGRVSD